MEKSELMKTMSKEDELKFFVSSNLYKIMLCADTMEIYLTTIKDHLSFEAKRDCSVAIKKAKRMVDLSKEYFPMEAQFHFGDLAEALKDHINTVITFE